MTDMTPEALKRNDLLFQVVTALEEYEEKQRRIDAVMLSLKKANSAQTQYNIWVYNCLQSLNARCQNG